LLRIFLKKYNIINVDENFLDLFFDNDAIRRKQEETNQDIFGDRLQSCKSIPVSTSQGLIMDSSIVCNATKDADKSRIPVFYYEIYPQNCDKNAYFFVNLDMTDFRRLQQDHLSPKTILCKTHQAYNILSRLLPYKDVKYTGFTSVDRFQPSISKNYHSFIHVAGKSPYKGTDQIVNAWLNHPEWPALTLICKGIEGSSDNMLEIVKNMMVKPQKNIILIDTYVSDEKLAKYMNENGIHLCTSKHEGFGHYLNEARSLEAVVLYTDAPPMNEKFEHGVSGISVKASNGPMINEGICPTYLVNRKSIEDAVGQVIGMSEHSLREIGKKARLRYLQDDRDFKKNIMSIL